MGVKYDEESWFATIFQLHGSVWPKIVTPVLWNVRRLELAAAPRDRALPR